MFIEMNKSKQLANTLIYQDILQLTWKSSYWRKYINLMLFIEKRVNTYWLERDSMGRGDGTLLIAILFKNFITQIPIG